MTELGTDYAQPLPALEGFSKDFYEFCKRGELRFQRCRDCGTWRHVPRELCAECASWSWEWARSSGRGRIFTWTVVERALHPAFADSVPYAPTVVEMEEGVRLVSTLVDVAPADLEIDMQVEVLFEPVTLEITLPRFKRASDE